MDILRTQSTCQYVDAKSTHFWLPSLRAGLSKYYQCNDTNAALRESARKMTEKWELDGIDCDEIEANSSLTLDGGFDFNSIWNSDFRNQAGRSSLAKESTIPPENFKMFFKEQVTSFTEDNKFNGNLKITIGENKFDLKVPFPDLTNWIGRRNL